MRYKKSLSLSLSWVMVPENGAVPATKSKDGFTSFPNVTCWTSQARLLFTRRLWRLSKNNYWSLIDTDKHITYHAAGPCTRQLSIVTKKSLSLSLRTQALHGLQMRTAKMIWLNHLCCSNCKAMQGLLHLTCKSDIHVIHVHVTYMLHAGQVEVLSVCGSQEEQCDSALQKVCVIVIAMVTESPGFEWLCTRRVCIALQLAQQQMIYQLKTNRSPRCCANCKAMQRWFLPHSQIWYMICCKQFEAHKKDRDVGFFLKYVIVIKS